MRALRDNRRFALARVLVLAFGICPALCGAVWGVWHRLPAHARSRAEALSHSLGCEVRFSSVEALAPGAWRYLEVVGVDTETSVTLFRCHSLKSWPEDGALRVSIEGMRVNRDALNKMSPLAERVLARWRSDQAPLRLTLEGPLTFLDGAEVADGVRFSVAMMKAGPQADLKFRLPGEPNTVDGEAVRWRIQRDRSTTNPRTRQRFQAFRPVPLPLLGLAEPSLLSGGAEATWIGTINQLPWSESSHEGYETQIDGQIEHLDLASVAKVLGVENFRGEAKLQLKSLVLRDGAPISAEGTLAISSGELPGASFEALCRVLSLSPNEAVRRPEEGARFEQWTTKFALSPNGAINYSMLITGSGDANEILAQGRPQSRSVGFLWQSALQVGLMRPTKAFERIALSPFNAIR